MKTNEELEIELEELKKQFHFFSKGGSPSKGQPSTSSGEEGWVVLYDMSSDDPAINLGKTKGIHGYDSYVNGMPDLCQFSKIRVTFFGYTAKQTYEFDIPDDTDYNAMRIIQTDGQAMFLTADGSFDLIGGKGLYYFGTIKQYQFISNRYPAVTTLNHEEYIRYEKIIGKLRD